MDRAIFRREAPARARHRSASLDAIRALALLGVVVMNTVAVTMVIAANKMIAAATPVDFAATIGASLLFQGKARACFAFLFGVGFGLLLERARAEGRGFAGFYARRMAALFGFGLFNQAFLFWGDILAHYAAIGCLLVLVHRWSDRALLQAGAALVVVPPIVVALPLALGHPLPNLAGAAEQASAYAAAAPRVYADGTYFEVVRYNLGRQPHAYLYDTAHRIEYDLSLLGLFLLGYLAARTHLLTEVERHRPTLRRVVRWCLPVGLALSLLNAARRLGAPLDGTADALAAAAFSGPSILALALVALLALWFARGGDRLQSWLAPAGQMALTNYLASGGVATWVTYGYGLDQLGRLNLAALVLLGIAIFVGLTALSHLWLRRFRIGPAEWLWRSISHARVMPLFAAGPTPRHHSASVA